jgi:hypothetical protein
MCVFVVSKFRVCEGNILYEVCVMLYVGVKRCDVVEYNVCRKHVCRMKCCQVVEGSERALAITIGLATNILSRTV